MFNKKKSYTFYSFLLLVVFFLPITITGLHSLSDHSHEICVSKDKIHFHDNSLDCDLHILKQGSSKIEIFNFNFLNNQEFASIEVLKNNFLSNHNSLSFLLRGPPSIVRA